MFELFEILAFLGEQCYRLNVQCTRRKFFGKSKTKEFRDRKLVG